MTREEEIKQAVENNLDVSVYTPQDGEMLKETFYIGAKWADANPKQGLVNLSQVWHPAEEEPQVEKQVLGIDYDGEAISGVFEHGSVAGIFIYDKLILYWDSVVRWAYIDDLLPKGGEQ